MSDYDPTIYVMSPREAARYFAVTYGPLGLLGHMMGNVALALTVQRDDPDGCIRRITEARELEYKCSGIDWATAYDGFMWGDND